MTKDRWLVWQKMKAQHAAAAEKLLQSQERWCMNACHRYLNRESMKGRVWVLEGRGGELQALVVFVRQALLPVFRGLNKIPSPHFLWSLYGTVPIHSVQGITEDALVMEAALRTLGLPAAQSNDYDLMCIDGAPSDYQTAGPAGLRIRKPETRDMDDLIQLHAGYEKEEVLTDSSDFNPVISRFHTERIIAQEQVLVAEIGGRLVGKINTNARAFTRCQIGGVYVHPDYRGRGIAQRMSGEFTASLAAQGLGVSLFVRKTNDSARRVYERIGFSQAGSYRVSYY